MYDIYQLSQQLDTQQPVERGEERNKEEVGGGKNEPPKFWVKRKTMANIIAEEITERQVSYDAL